MKILQDGKFKQLNAKDILEMLPKPKNHVSILDIRKNDDLKVPDTKPVLCKSGRR